MATNRYRRSPGVVLYWRGSQALCFAWQTSQRIPITPEAFVILNALTEWTTAEEVRDRVAQNIDVGAAQALLDLLHSLGLLEKESDSPQHSEWHEWPEAAFFHFATKNGLFPEDFRARDRELVVKAKTHPPPAPTKRIEGPRMRLPQADVSSGQLEDALKRRRTWRTFSESPVPAAALGTMLRLTFGVQARGMVEGQGRIIVRTSPSGGSRHPIEAYLLAWNVDGLAPGVYHFDSETSELVDLKTPISSSDIPSLLAHQTYFAHAGAAVVMCPVFARTMWRYHHSRAYRTMLIETGHLGQTFCLLAVALGLAPFTTMAFSEAGFESLLKLDGISECPFYVVGVGVPDPEAREHPGRKPD